MKPVVNTIENLFLFFFLLQILGCSSPHKAISVPGNGGALDSKLMRNLKAGEIHRYYLDLTAGQFVHIQAEQSGIDVIAKVTENQDIHEVFDSPTGELGVEDIHLLSNSGGKYEIEIYPAQKYADPGEYSIRIIRMEIASEGDKQWMAAWTATQIAGKLRAKNETRQQSILQYQTALTLWKELKDNLHYAHAMRSLGFVYIREKNYDKAMETFNQLQRLWNQLGDVRAEGFNTLIIGRIYDLQKNYSKSLEYNLNSLDFWKRGNDPDQESFVYMNIGNLYARLGEKIKAIHSFEQALKINEQSKRPSIKAVILRDYATAMLLVEEGKKAIQLYEQSIKQWQKTVNQHEEAQTAVKIAAHFAGKKDQIKAIQYYQYAMDLVKKLDDHKEIKTIQAALDKLEE